VLSEIGTCQSNGGPEVKKNAALVSDEHHNTENVNFEELQRHRTCEPTRYQQLDPNWHGDAIRITVLLQ
jgi:hypothetical protein